jgi:hypothetical protein
VEGEVVEAEVEVGPDLFDMLVGIGGDDERFAVRSVDRPSASRCTSTPIRARAAVSALAAG